MVPYITTHKVYIQEHVINGFEWYFWHAYIHFSARMNLRFMLMNSVIKALSGGRTQICTQLNIDKY